MTKEMKVDVIIQEQLAVLDRGFIATPASPEHLEAFARSNHGNSDMLLMQMSIQYGMRLAFEYLQRELAVETSK